MAVGGRATTSLKPFKELYGLDGAVISAVDLVKGIGICVGMKIINVKGATGNLNTNYKGKADAAVKALKECDFVYLHIEAPDECGHRQQIYEKIRAIELIDKIVVKRVLSGLKKKGSHFVFADYARPSPRRFPQGPFEGACALSSFKAISLDNKFSYDEQGQAEGII